MFAGEAVLHLPAEMLIHLYYLVLRGCPGTVSTSGVLLLHEVDFGKVSPEI